MPTSAERAARARKAHTSRSGRGRWPWLVGAGVAGGVIVVALLALGGGGGGPEAGDEAGGRANRTAAAAATVDLARRAGGLSEGAVRIPDSPPAPPASELRSNGGKRFGIPLKAHAGVEDYFGTPRLYGLTHGGIDFSLAGLSEVPVLAGCGGRVTDVGSDETYGLHVTIDCGSGWETVHGFLESASAVPGAEAALGQEIGTGRAGGHLHFEIRYQGTPVDPVDYIDVPRRVPNTPTPSPTSTPRPGATATPTKASSAPAGASPAATPTATGTATSTPTVTNTPTITPTPTWTPTPTRTPVRAVTATPTLPVAR